MPKSLMYDILKMYQVERIGSTETCLGCQQNALNNNNILIGPLPIYHVGDNFSNAGQSILFVGSVAYGWDDSLPDRQSWVQLIKRGPDDNALQNIVSDIDARAHELYLNNQSLFWHTIRQVSQELFGDLSTGWERIAVSNFVHCNLGEVSANSMYGLYSRNCAHKIAGQTFLLREIKVLQPDTIVFMAGNSFNNYAKEWKLPSISKPYYFWHPSNRQGKNVLSDILKVIG